MQIVKKINNNVALASSENGMEFIVIGKGIGFPKMPYHLEDLSSVDQYFVNMVDPQIKTLFAQLPEDDILLAKEIVENGKSLLNKTLADSILITLSDHLHQAIERHQSGVELKTPLRWGMHHVYTKEIEAGKEALAIIERRRGIRLPEMEAVFIALHFVNAQLARKNHLEPNDDAEKMLDIVDEILVVVRAYYQEDLDEDSMNFTRFVTHLQYFILRQLKNTPLNGEIDAMFEITKKEYQSELNCVKRVENLLEMRYNWLCTKDEKFYLALHLRRLLARKNEESTDCH